MRPLPLALFDDDRPPVTGLGGRSCKYDQERHHRKCRDHLQLSLHRSYTLILLRQAIEREGLPAISLVINGA